MRKRIGYLIVLIGLLTLAAWGCKKKDIHITHDYGEWTIVTTATCTKDGEKERVCSCGKKQTEVIAATGHTEVVDPAVEATCLTSGKTKGSHCSVCQTIIKEQKVTKPKHKEYTLEAVGVTCTRAGKGKGIRCKECGAVIQRQKKIRATGHVYKNGICTKCGETQPDMAVAVIIDQLNEEKQANLITKKAYPGGTTMTFYAYVPKNVSWWAVSWTTDPKKIGLYDWAEGDGCLMDAESGKWQKCSITLPESKKSYYIYFVGAKGEWSNQELTIDDITITDPKGKVIATETFDQGIDRLFSTVKVNPSTMQAVVYEKVVCEKHQIKTDKAVKATCVTDGKTKGTHCSLCKKILSEPETVKATGHVWKNGKCKKCNKERENLVAALAVDQLNDASPANFITKKAYPGGSSISFRVWIPKNVTGWAAVSWTTDPSKVSLYEWGESGSQIQAKPGEWTKCSVTLPKDGKKYYIYFVGEKGQFKGKELMIDDVRITSAGGKLLAADDFDNGVANGIFDIVAVNPTSGALVVYDKTGEDPCRNGHKIVVDKAVKATCAKTGKTEGKHCSVCDTILKEQKEVPALGHDYNDDGVCKRCGDKIVNRAVAITIDQLNEAGSMNFITRRAYAGGSTISLRAYVPEGTGWWAISWTTDPTDTGLYKWTDEKGSAQGSVYNKWADYSLTLPDDGNTYYIYIVGAKGEWAGKKLQIDDVKIVSQLGETVAKDDFNSGMHSGIFRIIETNPTTGNPVVEEIKVGDICKHKNLASDPNVDPDCMTAGKIGKTYCLDCGETVHEETVLNPVDHSYKNGACIWCHKKENEAGTKDMAAAIHIEYLNEYQSEGRMNFITKDAYKGGSKVSFKVYVPQGASWCNIYWTTAKDQGDCYGSGAAGSKAIGSGVGEWKEYTFTLPEGDASYYLYIAGPKGEWKNKTLLVDDFQIETGGVVKEDHFDTNLTDGLFDVIAEKGGNIVVSLEESR